MSKFFIKTEKTNPYEIGLLVDGSIFSLDIVLKAAYELIDQAYMFFEKDKKNTYVYFKSKDKKTKSQSIAEQFSQELVYHRLREQIEKKTQANRQKIIDLAIGFSTNTTDISNDLNNIEKELINRGILAQDIPEQPSNNQNIETIINDISNDPDFAEDKDEIINILKEIENN